MLLNTLLSANATQIMRRPDTYKTPARKFKTESSPQIMTVGRRDVNETQAIDLNRRANGKASFAYFTNWGIYGANFRESI